MLPTNRLLDTLAELSRLALGETDLQVLLDRTVTRLAETLEAEFALVLELMPGGDAYVLRSGVGWRPGLVGRTVVPTGSDPPFLRDHGVTSSLSATIPGQPQPFGVVGIHTTRRRRFTAAEQTLVQLVADLLASAAARRRTEQLLGESETRFRLLSDSGILGIFLADLTGRINEANDSFLQMLGYTREDLQAGRLRWDCLTAPEYAHLDAYALEEIQRTGTFTPYEKEYLRREGSRVPVLLAGGLVGAEGLCIAYIVDLTTRRRAEVRFQALFESVPDAILTVDQRGHIGLVNAAAERAFGYPRADLVGRNIESLVPERLAGQHAAQRVRYMAQPTSRPMGLGMDLVARRKDGAEFPVEVSLSPMQSSEGAWIICVVRDISERLASQALSRREICPKS